MTHSDVPEVSVVVTLYNEEGAVDALFERLIPVLESAAESFEVVCVNDGSTDSTLDRLVDQAERNGAIRIVDLSRNFGKERALTAALEYASGHAVIPMDADLQDPPELIPELLAKWRDGYDVVNATRASREGESWLKKTSAKGFYRIINRLSGIRVPPNTGDFRLLDRKAVDAIMSFPERVRFMKGLFAWIGFRETTVYFDREARHSGKSKWKYWRLWNYALDGITSFSSWPLTFWSYVGFIISLLAFSYAIFMIGKTLIYGKDVPGYASLIVVVLFMGGVQLISLGVIGEYIARIYTETKRRPLFLVRKRYGFEGDDVEEKRAKTSNSRK